MTVISQHNITQLAPVRIGLEFTYDHDASKWIINSTALADLRFYNVGGQMKAHISAPLAIPPALLTALQNAWDARLTQYLGAGGDGEGLTVYVPQEETTE